MTKKDYIKSLNIYSILSYEFLNQVKRRRFPITKTFPLTYTEVRLLVLDTKVDLKITPKMSIRFG